MDSSTGLHVLGIVTHGLETESLSPTLHPSSLGANPEGPVVARTPLEVLGPPQAELFETPRPPSFGFRHGIRFGEDGVVLFGAVDIGEGDLESITHDAYHRLVQLVEESGYPHLLRLWASVPGINQIDGGLERYRHFCRGRSLALESAHGSAFESRLCASTAVGSAAGPLSLYFLASTEAGIHLENPRQVAAYHYPPEYGPRSPSFARATVAPPSLEGSVFVAGTASIVGHETCHAEDVSAQLRETLKNLEALATTLPARRPDEEAARVVKVYLRNPADIDRVRECLATSSWAAPDRTLFLRADICREPLLLEIEGIA